MIIDIVFTIVAFVGFVLGFKAGVMKVLLVGFSLLIALILTLTFTPDTNQILKDFFRMNSTIMPFLAFILTFVLSIGFVKLMGEFLEAFLRSLELDLFNQVAGGLIVGLTGLFLYSGILWFLQKADIITAKIEVIDPVVGKVNNDYFRIIDPKETLIVKDSSTHIVISELFKDDEEPRLRTLQKTIREQSSYQNSKTIKFVNIFLEQFDIFMHAMQNLVINLWNEMRGFVVEKPE